MSIKSRLRFPKNGGNMMKLAKHIIFVNGSDLSVHHLQKIMYFAIVEYIKEKGVDNKIKKVYDSEFEAWDYGPINREVYILHRYGKICGEYEQKLSFLDLYIKKYAKEEKFFLVEKSQKSKVWKDNKEAILSRKKVVFYTIEDLSEDSAIL